MIGMARTFTFLCLLLFLGSCGNPSSVSLDKMELTTLAGEVVDLSQYAGKRVFLNFWATWCGPCRAEMPSMQLAQNTLAEENYAFVLVSNESAQTIQGFIEDQAYAFDFYQMPQSMKFLGIFSIPQTYLISTEGKVIHAFTGSYDWNSQHALEILRSVP